VHSETFEQLIVNLERAGAPYSLPADRLLYCDDDILRSLASRERRKWLKKAKAEALRRNLQERIDEIAEAADNEDTDFAEVLLKSFIEDSKNFPDLSEWQRRRWIKRATLTTQRYVSAAPDDLKCVYFIGTDDEFIKIGFTTNLLDRVRSLSTGSPRDFRVHLVVRGDRDDERELHRRFAAYHVRGEWFRFTEAIVKFIADRKAVDATASDWNLNDTAECCVNPQLRG
jgi:hypothetical protein